MVNYLYSRFLHTLLIAWNLTPTLPSLPLHKVTCRTPCLISALCTPRLFPVTGAVTATVPGARVATACCNDGKNKWGFLKTVDHNEIDEGSDQ